MLTSKQKIKIVYSYEKSLKLELEKINNSLSTGFYIGNNRNLLLNRKYSILKKIAGYREYVLNVL